MAQSNEPTTEQMDLIIARFMGMEGSDDFIRQNYQYHKSWQQLMPVVEKIHTLKKRNQDGKDLCLMSKLTVNMELDGYYRKGRCYKLSRRPSMASKYSQLQSTVLG